MWQMRRSIIAERLHLLQRCSGIGSRGLVTESGCITCTSQFEEGCSNQHALYIALRGYLDTIHQPAGSKPSEFENRSYRYAAYRQYIWLMFGKLGRGVRYRIPSCAVSAIRRKYPNAEGEPYHGFAEATDDDQPHWPG
eukprot:scpid97615/ scgid13544/ 